MSQDLSTDFTSAPTNEDKLVLDNTSLTLEDDLGPLPSTGESKTSDLIAIDKQTPSLTDSLTTVYGQIQDRFRSKKIPDFIKIAGLRNTESFEPTEDNRLFLNTFIVNFFLQNIMALFVLKSCPEDLNFKESFLDLLVRYSLLFTYFGISTFFVLKKPDLQNSSLVIINIGLGVLLGFSLPFRSFAKAFVYSNLGTIISMYLVLYFNRNLQISISGVKKYVIGGVIVANIVLDYLLDDRHYVYIVLGALFFIFYGLELVNIVFDRINDYDLDSEVRNSSPEFLSVCIPAKACLDFWKKVITGPSFN